ncbi:hypothetical protein [Mycoplasma sp. P36-A1]|uniref:hypothetical protein n=1 Tax=Mycoplasma sp. P36-A1 TaxID=3252900 RepID=UPI003C2FC5F7
MENNVKPTKRKIIEIVIIIGIITILFILIPQIPKELEYYILLVSVVFFASYYGIYIGIIALSLSLASQMLLGITRHEDLLLYFWDSTYLFQLLTLVVLTYLCGSMATAKVEQKAYNKDENFELSLENSELKKAINQLNVTKDKLKNKVLVYDNQTGKMFDMLTTFQQTPNNNLQKTALEILSSELDFKDVVIYEQNNQSDNWKTAHLISDKEKQEIEISNKLIELMNEDRLPIVPLLDNDTKTILLGPVYENDKLKYVIAIDDVDIANISSEHFTLFSMFTKIYGLRLGLKDKN